MKISNLDSQLWCQARMVRPTVRYLDRDGRYSVVSAILARVRSNTILKRMAHAAALHLRS